MTKMRHHPAVFAGLMGGSTVGVSTIAFAAPLDGMVGSSTGPIVLQLALGCATGAALAVGIAYVAERVYARNHPYDAEDELEHEAELSEQGLSGASTDVVQSMPLDQDEGAPDSVLAAHEEQFAIETTVLDELALQRQLRHLRQARHLDQDATIRISASDVDSIRLRSARHFVAAGHSQLMTDAAVEALADMSLKARHFAPPAESNELSLQDPPVEEQHFEQPVPQEPAADVVETPVAPAGEDVEADAKKPSLFVRVSAKVKGMRKALTTRLASTSDTDDIPIIRRADGSATEVALPRLNQAIAPAIESIVSSLDEPSDTDQFNVLPPSEPNAEHASNAASSQSAYISRHVSEVEVGLYPERRSIDELRKGDMWEEALVAMGDTLGQEPSQLNGAGDRPLTIDETRRIEVPSERARSRAIAERVGSVDTDTYVDYLLRDELSHSSVEVLRSSPHAHLRVIEGGTGSMHEQKRAGQTSTQVKKGRHYAPESMAREA